MHCITLYMSYLLFALQFRNHCYLPHISLVALEKFLHVLFKDDRKGTSGDYFSILIILIPSR
jgi:hypothetical protein